MAEQTPQIQNKKLLIVALILAAVVVVLFNVYITRARSEGKEAAVEVAAFAQGHSAGFVVHNGDMVSVKFPEKFLNKNLTDVVLWKDRNNVKDYTLVRDVTAEELVRYSHVRSDSGNLPNVVASDMTTFTFPVDADKIPGDILLPNMRINVWGMFNVAGRQTAMMVVRKVRVVSVGGRGAQESGPFQAGRGTAGGLRSYRSVTIEVPENVAQSLANIQTHATQPFWVSVLNQDQTTARPAIEEGVKSLSAGARPVPAAGPASGGVE